MSSGSGTVFQRIHVRSSVFVLALLVTLTTMLPSPGSAMEEAGLSQVGTDSRTADVPLAEVRSVAGDGSEFVAGEVIVRFEPGTPAADRTAARAAVQATMKRDLLFPGMELVTLPAGLTVQLAVQLLEANPNVAYAEPNYVMKVVAIPDDPLFGDLWGLNNTGQTVNGVAGTVDADIDAPEAWNITQGNANVLVGIIDSGIAYDHPDLVPNLWLNPGEEQNGLDDDGNGFVDDWRGWDFVNDDNDPRDGNGHGSHVAGTIGARGNNTTGITGVAPQVSLVMAQACDAAGSCPSSAVADALMYVAGLGVRIANVSLGGTTFSQAQFDAIAANPDTLYVVAAGNSNTDVDSVAFYPCAYDLSNILCVSATDANDSRASFSNFGASGVDLSAPGVNTLSTYPSFTTRFSDAFEGGFAAWVTGGTNNTWAIDSCPTGAVNCLVDSPGSQYQNNTNSWAQTVASIDVATGVAECSVLYSLALEMQSGDALWLEVSTNQTNWVALVGWTGSTGGSFFPFRTPIDASVGSPIYLRYRLFSDGSGRADGAYIDSVEVRCVDTTTTTYRFLSGTSMAAPHVAGTAALLQAVRPGITAAQMRTILMDTVDPIVGLTGTSVTGGRLNAHLAVLAAASNAAPVAGDDSYGVYVDTLLTVAAPGVLGNDTDADGDQLTVSASDAASVEGGVVSVAAGGSFTFMPAAGFVGSDSFGYTISDGALTDTATVTITVSAPPPPGGGGGGGGGEVLLPPSETCPDTLEDPGFVDLDGLSSEAQEAVTCLVAYGITQGTSATTFSPTLEVTRWQMALFLTRQVSVHGMSLPAVELHGFIDIGSLPEATQDAINQLATLGITVGTSPTTFDPMSSVARWQMALFLTRLADLVEIPLDEAPPSPFVDVDGLSAEAQLAINQLAAAAIAQGTSDTTFSPMSAVTRWQMALFLTRVLTAGSVTLG
ncbi:MAG TPA: S8 family serine peptidase [Acidimicrobiia bacterium]|nr:S8 family serine peptidase [Acidimicrobiia bacterium]